MDDVLERPPVDVPASSTPNDVEEPESDEAQAFSFDAHGREAAERYQPVQRLYSDFAHAIGSILGSALTSAQIRIHTLEQRGKDLSSFRQKASQASEADPSEPKYPDPLTDVTDLAAARVITFFLSDLAPIRAQIYAQFDVLEEIDKTQQLEDEGRFVGYQSQHYVISLKRSRVTLPEYARFADLIGEVQVRTIMQHAWAEIEHDMQYKSVSTLPGAIRGRFAQLAGMLAVADREFQAIQLDEIRLREAAAESIKAGDLDEVEITAAALKSYLDRRLGPDGRIRDWAYDWSARLLGRLGFSNFGELDELLNGIDDDALSRKVWGSRQGQMTRFEDMLLLALGDRYIQTVPYQAWRAERFRASGVDVPIGTVGASNTIVSTDCEES